MSIRSGVQSVLTAPLVLAVTSCAGGDAATYAGAVVDTLANGAVSVHNTAEGLWALTGETPWRLEEELRIGQMQGEGPYTFGSIRAIIPNPDGSMWVFDSQARELRLFDTQGQSARTIGRPGEGPGEFAFNPCAFEALNEEIWVEDGGRRWQRFDRQGTLLGQFTSPSNIGCGVRVRTTDGRFFAVQLEAGGSPMDRSAFYIEYGLDDAGELVSLDTFPTPTLPPAPSFIWVNQSGRGRISQNVPLTHRPSAGLGPSGDWLVASGGGPYLLSRQSLQGDTLLVISRDHQPVTTPDSIRNRLIEAAPPEGFVSENGFSPDKVPSVYPPFERIVEATDRTLWLTRYGAGGVLALDVFSAEGMYLGEADVPDDFARISIHEITAEHLYGVFRDELDVPYVIRLAIRRGAQH